MRYNSNSFDICDNSRNAQGPEELPPEGVSDEAVDGEVGRGVEHHERVRDVGHDLAPVSRQVRPVRRYSGAPGESDVLSMTRIGQIKWEDGISGQLGRYGMPFHVCLCVSRTFIAKYHISPCRSCCVHSIHLYYLCLSTFASGKALRQ